MIIEEAGGRKWWVEVHRKAIAATRALVAAISPQKRKSSLTANAPKPAAARPAQKPQPAAPKPAEAKLAEAKPAEAKPAGAPAATPPSARESAAKKNLSEQFSNSVQGKRKVFSVTILVILSILVLVAQLSTALCSTLLSPADPATPQEVVVLDDTEDDDDKEEDLLAMLTGELGSSGRRFARLGLVGGVGCRVGDRLLTFCCREIESTLRVYAQVIPPRRRSGPRRHGRAPSPDCSPSLLDTRM